MSLKYFNCPDNVTRPIAVCLSGCPRRPEGACLAMSHLLDIADQREFKGKPSVTQLIKGTRLAYLEITEDYAVDPDTMAFLIYGRLHHKRVDAINKKLAGLSEQFVGDENINGTLDRLEPDELNEGFYKLIDYKLCGAYSVVSDKLEWQLQLNRYRLLVESSPKLKDLFPISRMFIQATIRDSGLRQMESLNLPKRMPLIEVAKMDDTEVFYYFHDKERALLNALEDKVMPARCNNVESWNGRRCKKYCSLVSFCREGAMIAKVAYQGR